MYLNAYPPRYVNFMRHVAPLLGRALSKARLETGESSVSLKRAGRPGKWSNGQSLKTTRRP